jgi:hypothetical protein
VRALGVLLALLSPACVEAWAQPRPARDAGVRDAGVRARDAGVRTRDAGVRARDAGVDVAPLPPTHGRIEAEVVSRTLAGRRAAVRQCYEHEIAHDATLRGEITVRLRVETDGHVSQTSTGGDPALLRVGRCIEDVLRPLRFPPPTGGPATVAVPFVFQQGD